MAYLPFDDLLSGNNYARKCFYSSRDHLIVGLWGSFERAAVGLSSLYRGKLDDCCGSEFLIDTLQRIHAFYRASQEMIHCAQKQGAAFGYHCQRLVIRDRFLKDSDGALLSGDEIFSSVLQAYDKNALLPTERKRRHYYHHQFSKRCCQHKVAKKKWHSEKDPATHFKKEVPLREAFDFSSVVKDPPMDWPSRFVNFTALCPSYPVEFLANLSPKARHGGGRGSRQPRPFKFNNGSSHETLISSPIITNLLRTSALGPPTVQDVVTTPTISTSRKRLVDQSEGLNDTNSVFSDAVHLSSLIDPLSKFGLGVFPSSPKRQRMNLTSGSNGPSCPEPQNSSTK